MDACSSVTHATNVSEGNSVPSILYVNPPDVHHHRRVESEQECTEGGINTG